MRRRIGRYVVTMGALGMFCAGCKETTVRDQEGVRWPGAVVPFQPTVLHAPDNRFGGPAPDPVTVRDFGHVMQHPGLQRLLGVPQDEFDRADVIAFEGNAGGAPEGGWESSIWTFMDGTNSYVASFNENVGRASDPAVVASGSLIGPDGTISSGNTAYSAFFRMCCPDPSNPVVSYILFDLDAVSPAVDTDSPSFAITLGVGFRVFGPEGSPDPDAIGVLTKCPKPCPAR